MRGIKFQTLHAKNVRTSSMSKTWLGRRPVFARKGRNKAAIHLLKFAAAPK